MLMTKERRPAIRTLRGWAISVLHEAYAIRECEEHGWMQDRTDPHARDRAIAHARHHAPVGISAEEAVAAVEDVLDYRRRLSRMAAGLRLAGLREGDAVAKAGELEPRLRDLDPTLPLHAIRAHGLLHRRFCLTLRIVFVAHHAEYRSPMR